MEAQGNSVLCEKNFVIYQRVIKNAWKNAKKPGYFLVFLVPNSHHILAQPLSTKSCCSNQIWFTMVDNKKLLGLCK
jgi:hypothetical protein